MYIEQVELLFDSMAEHLEEELSSYRREDVVMVGIHTGGVWVAERLHALLKLPIPLGLLNIAFYRDDFTRAGLPKVQPSLLPVSVDERHVVLVDDVLYTGRTVRAALNEIFDYGRPASIKLAVLVKRDGRQLPIEPDVIGCYLHLTLQQHVKLHGPDPLFLEIQ